MTEISRQQVFGFVLFVLVAGQLATAQQASDVSSAPSRGLVTFAELDTRWTRDAQPILQAACVTCHSTAELAGDLDLERFGSLEEIRLDPNTWQKALEMIQLGEMPPKDADPLAADAKQRLVTWIEDYLLAEAYANAGDPGPVGLRRLSNAEYTYTIRDLTGLELDPAREFPPDGAAGEGFTNASSALVMSPALLAKYLEAGKQIAQHLVLLPEGVRFAPGTTRRDWTDELLGQIRTFYGRFAKPDGLLPLREYLAAASLLRDQASDDSSRVEKLASAHGLNGKYLSRLVAALRGDAGKDAASDKSLSPLLNPLQTQWRSPGAMDVEACAAQVEAWQAVLFRRQNVGHMKPWIVDVDPLVTEQQVRLPLPTTAGQAEWVVHLAVGAAGDGADSDEVRWRSPRLVAAGRPDLLLRDVPQFVERLERARRSLFAAALPCLLAADQVAARPALRRDAQFALSQGIDPVVLNLWLEYLGIGESADLRLRYFTQRIESSAGYDFVRGWGTGETPNLVGNGSSQAVRIPGNLKPQGVVIHPSPTEAAAVGWQAPAAGNYRLQATVTHAHPECGNGVVWSLELRRGVSRLRLAEGVAAGATPVVVGPLEHVVLQAGDLVSLLIGPRDGNHACDLTDLELTIQEETGAERDWSLTRDLAARLAEGNPQADRYGQAAVWHFYTEPLASRQDGTLVPAGSCLALWQAAAQPESRRMYAQQLQTLLQNGPPADPQHPDAQLYRQLASLSGPLLRNLQDGVLAAQPATDGPADAASDAQAAPADGPWGVDPSRFGTRLGKSAEPEDLVMQPGEVLSCRLPADLVAGCEFVASVTLADTAAEQGSVQIHLGTELPTELTECVSGRPILITESPQNRQRWQNHVQAFRDLFPPALFYAQIVPVDEVVTLTLFHREDEPLQRLMLTDQECQTIDRMWDELHFVSEDALTQVDAFAQLMEYATQDSDPRLFAPYREPIERNAAAHRARRMAAQPAQLEAVLGWAAKIYRRPLTHAEKDDLRTLYGRLRAEQLPHDEALRLMVARLFVAPAFLYRLEHAAHVAPSQPVNDWELASRLSYFLWATQPDDRLWAAAEQGQLQDPQQLKQHVERMLKDERIRRLAVQFGTQWLHIYEFDTLDEKSERHFPEFAELRGAMYEEAIRNFTDLFQQDGSLLELIDGDHTYVNARLAQFYGTSFDPAGPEWQRVTGVREQGRGGVLGMAAVLAKQSGASRTSPILRGNWVSEVLLGEKLPRPPQGVPTLPEDEAATADLTVRQLVERHSRDPKCAGCHVRVDPIGYALETYDAIGRRRSTDLAGRPIDTQTTLLDGTPLGGPQSLREYLLQQRRDAILRQFCRKLLGYALGRSVQLSDEPLLRSLQEELRANDYRVSVAVQAIVASRQFREIRAAGELASRSGE